MRHCLTIEKAESVLVAGLGLKLTSSQGVGLLKYP